LQIIQYLAICMFSILFFTSLAAILFVLTFIKKEKNIYHQRGSE
jgi:hypothetical protein